MPDGRVERLADALAGPPCPYERGDAHVILDVATWIVHNPQLHVDALVEAGVLTVADEGFGATYYRVVQPHVHEWRVERVIEGKSVLLYCKTCPYPEGRWEVPNRLPIEVPDELA